MGFSKSQIIRKKNLKLEVSQLSVSCNFVSIKSDNKMIQVTLNTKTKNIDSKENVVAFLNSVTIKEIAYCHMSLIEKTLLKASYARQTFKK